MVWLRILVNDMNVVDYNQLFNISLTSEKVSTPWSTPFFVLKKAQYNIFK